MAALLPYVLLGIALVAMLSVVAWLRFERPRSPLKSVDEFHDSLRALSSTAGRNRQRRRPA